jgi:hypothetical protein
MAKRTAAALTMLLVTALLIGPSTPAGAQNQTVRFDGRVQWVVTVIGVITDGNRRVLGTSVVRGGAAEAP